jgi:hypothetical protein
MCYKILWTTDPPAVEQGGPMEKRMVDTQPKVLAVGIDHTVFERLAPVLRRSGIDVDWVPTLEAGLVLVTNQPFDAIVLGARPSGASLEDVLRVIRGDGSASSDKAIVVLGEPEEIDVARAFEGNGVNRVILASDTPELIRDSLSRFFAVAPRASLRLPISVEAATGPKGQSLFCQTENLSLSGMLVKTRHRPEIGSTVSFKIHLSEAGTILGRGELVRYATEDQGNVDGIGIRFLDFSENGAARLHHHLVQNGSPVPGDMNFTM